MVFQGMEKSRTKRSPIKKIRKNDVAHIHNTEHFDDKDPENILLFLKVFVKKIQCSIEQASTWRWTSSAGFSAEPFSWITFVFLLVMLVVDRLLSEFFRFLLHLYCSITIRINDLWINEMRKETEAKRFSHVHNVFCTQWQSSTAQCFNVHVNYISNFLPCRRSL